MTYKSYFAEDVPEIQSFANAHGFVFDSQADVITQWLAFSGTQCASWLHITTETLLEFVAFLEKQPLEKIC